MIWLQIKRDKILYVTDLIDINGGASKSVLIAGIGLGIVAVTCPPVAAVVLGVTAGGLTVGSFFIDDND